MHAHTQETGYRDAGAGVAGGGAGADQNLVAVNVNRASRLSGAARKGWRAVAGDIIAAGWARVRCSLMFGIEGALGAILSTVKIVLAAAAGALLPAVSVAVPAAIEIPRLPL